jgi:hypothetical protein
MCVRRDHLAGRGARQPDDEIPGLLSRSRATVCVASLSLRLPPCDAAPPRRRFGDATAEPPISLSDEAVTVNPAASKKRRGEERRASQMGRRDARLCCAAAAAAQTDYPASPKREPSL